MALIRRLHFCRNSARNMISPRLSFSLINLAIGLPLSRLGLSGQLNYVDRNLIEKWFHTFKMRVDLFHNSWVGSRASVREWIEQFIHYYNTQRPHQSLNGQTPAEVLN